MVHLLSEATPRAAKPHRCYDCGAMIPKGERHYVSACLNDGTAYSIRSHIDCRGAALEYSSHGYDPDYYDGIPPLYEMIADGGNQYDLDAMRGHWPHVVCRIELLRWRSKNAYSKRQAATQRKE